MDLEFSPYVRKPFQVEAIEITKKNIADIAQIIGELKTNDGNPYILIDRRVVPSMAVAYPGFWVTRVNNNYLCFAGKVFRKLFMEHAPIIAFNFMSEDDADKDAQVQMLKEYLQRVTEDALAEAAVAASAAHEVVEEESDPTPAHGTERPEVAEV